MIPVHVDIPFDSVEDMISMNRFSQSEWLTIPTLFSSAAGHTLNET